jgi:hypothetical protein
MRLLCEIFVVGALIYLGWKKPFKEWIGQKSEPPIVAATPSPRPIVRATAIPSQPGWMYDPNHRSPLDTPRPNPITAQPQPSKSASASWLFDPNHRSPLDPPPTKHPSPN